MSEEEVKEFKEFKFLESVIKSDTIEKYVDNNDPYKKLQNK